jgi:hypothetical protein
MNYLFIILGIVVVIILYFIYSYLFPSKSKVATKNYLANGVQTVSFEKLENPGSMKYSIEVWIYANSLTGISSDYTENTGGGMENNRDGCIFEIYRKEDSGGRNVCHLNLFKDGTLAFYNNQYTTRPTIVSPSFPLQRWVYVVISVDNTLVDLYLDGKLIRSVKLAQGFTPGSPGMDSRIEFGKGDIYIAGMNRTASTTDSNTVFKNYMQGNAGLKVPGYTVSFDFLKNSKIAQNIAIM